MDSSTYSRADRLLHRMAFGGIELQKAVADIEDRLYARPLAAITEQPPVFISSLPRAGTTLLLEAMTVLPGSVAHTYRNMPFVLCPLLWDQISRPFHAPNAVQARAHGDGMDVGFDSAEAFEEVLWMAFWPEKYEGAGISLWQAGDRAPEFEDFFRRHMRKLILAKGRQSGRYLSKNNANIARIPLLRRLFPEGRIIVPFRDPLDQAASLLKQHRRFTALHARDPFARYYMESIGHLEFGAAFKPIAFANLGPAAPDSMAFWLGYWTAAFLHVLEHVGANVHLVDFHHLCASPEASLRALGVVLGQPEALIPQAAMFRPAASHDVDSETRALPESEAAYAIYDRLRSQAINRP